MCPESLRTAYEKALRKLESLQRAVEQAQRDRDVLAVQLEKTQLENEQLESRLVEMTKAIADIQRASEVSPEESRDHRERSFQRQKTAIFQLSKTNSVFARERLAIPNTAVVPARLVDDESDTDVVEYGEKERSQDRKVETSPWVDVPKTNVQNQAAVTQKASYDSLAELEKERVQLLQQLKISTEEIEKYKLVQHDLEGALEKACALSEKYAGEVQEQQRSIEDYREQIESLEHRNSSLEASVSAIRDQAASEKLVACRLLATQASEIAKLKAEGVRLKRELTEFGSSSSDHDGLAPSLVGCLSSTTSSQELPEFVEETEIQTWTNDVSFSSQSPELHDEDEDDFEDQVTVLENNLIFDDHDD